MFIKYLLSTVHDGNIYSFFRLSASTILLMADGISAIFSGRNGDKKACISTSSDVIPHHIVVILPHYFSFYQHRHHRQFLSYTFRFDDMEIIMCQKMSLCDLYHLQHDLKSSNYILNNDAAYRNAWIRFHSTCPFVERFVGSLETIFPGTCTI